jgi:DNA polymerase sigma
LAVRDHIEDILRKSKKIKLFELIAFGSLENGLLDRESSDLDLTILFDQNQSHNHFEILNKVRRIL